MTAATVEAETMYKNFMVRHEEKKDLIHRMQAEQAAHRESFMDWQNGDVREAETITPLVEGREKEPQKVDFDELKREEIRKLRLERKHLEETRQALYGWIVACMMWFAMMASVVGWWVFHA